MSASDGLDRNAREAVLKARLWHGASDEALEWLCDTASIGSFEKGELLFRQGDVPDCVALIVSGHGRGVSRVESHTSVVETLWPGDVIGAIAAFSGTPFESDVEAVEPVRAVMIPVDALKDLLTSEPTIALAVIEELSRRWVDALNTARRSTLDVSHRLVDYLERLPQTPLGESGYYVELPTSRGELADLLGTTPETLSRTFKVFESAGLLETHASLVVVPDARALAEHRPGGRPQREPASEAT